MKRTAAIGGISGFFLLLLVGCNRQQVMQVASTGTIKTNLDKPVVISDGSPLRVNSKRGWYTIDATAVKPQPQPGKVRPDDSDTDTYTCSGTIEKPSAGTNAGRPSGGYSWFLCGNDLELVIKFTEDGGKVHTIRAETSASQQNLTISTDQGDCIFHKISDTTVEYWRNGQAVNGKISSVNCNNQGEVPPKPNTPTKVAINHTD